MFASKSLEFIVGLSLAKVETDSLFFWSIVDDTDHFILVLGGDVKEGAVLHNLAHEEESNTTPNEL